MTTRIDGREAGTGRASAFPDGAIGAARFLFELMAARGIALQPGQWISSGAVTGVHRVRAGQTVEARFSADLAVACSLVAARAGIGSGAHGRRPRTPSDPAGPRRRVGNYRWVIVGLLFAATVINYVDRQMLGVLKPTLAAELSWNEIDYANVVFWFQTAYAIGYIGFGRIVDLIGARLGYAAAFLIWTIAHIAHGGVRSVTQFAAVRFALGIGEAGNFPAGIKAVTEWFPAKERAFAIGVFNAGANIGAIVTPLVVPWLTVAYGWRIAFVVTGLASLVWLVAWLAIYRRPGEHRKAVRRGACLYPAGPGRSRRAVAAGAPIAARRETWAYRARQVLHRSDLVVLPVLAAGLSRRALPSRPLAPSGRLWSPSTCSPTSASVVGGWASSRMIQRRAQRQFRAQVDHAGLRLRGDPDLLRATYDSLWVAVLVIGLATAAHQAFSANLYTLPSDLFPRNAVGSVIGIGGTVGAVGGMIFTLYIGQILERIGTYTPIFIVAGSAYFIALAAHPPALAAAGAGGGGLGRSFPLSGGERVRVRGFGGRN